MENKTERIQNKKLLIISKHRTISFINVIDDVSVRYFNVQLTAIYIYLISTLLIDQSKKCCKRTLSTIDLRFKSSNQIINRMKN